MPPIAELITPTTFDEFGLWVHLGGIYWQRASFDEVVVIGALLILIAVAPEWRRLQPHHWFTAVALALASLMFGVLFVDSFRYADGRCHLGLLGDTREAF